MNEMMNYIFSSLRNSEKAVTVVQKTLRKQARFNKNMAIYALAMTMCAIWLEMNRQEQNERIERLEKEVKKLKRDVGEQEMR